MFFDDDDTAGVDRAIRCLERSIDFGSVIIEFTGSRNKLCPSK